ncbi:FecR domain-containing protein [Hymenobacter pini]|uniref:FecR domain-containing protein n=1 Tax=Hymenobacter pini TaxID=2880879 RepID=UPI001CF2B508|nr:FecR domain-containing protein [Hymenobacter pini]MCA8833067.1 FecR domain-containing protein [Hymenobacter pini]
MENSAAHELMGKELAGELTPAEHERLQAWLDQASPVEKATYEATKQYWRIPAQPVATPAQTAAALHALWNRIDEVSSEETTARILPFRPAAPWWRSRMAAAVAGMGLLAGGIYYGVYPRLRNEAGAPLAYAEQAVAQGATTKVLLADGTTVWLNADSRLWYPKKFTSQQREVSLQGEAFFEVAHDRQHPFVLHVGQQQVRVLGTSFNVKAYPNEPTVETAVVTGRVAFIRAAGSGGATSRDTLYVTPNQRVVFNRQTAAMQEEATDSREAMAWRQGELVFRQTPLDEVARTLARRYNVPVQLANDQLRHCQLTGSFRNQPLREVVSLLSMTGTFNYTLTDKQLTITGNGCH